MTDDQILLVLLMLDAGLPREEAMLFLRERVDNIGAIAIP